MLSRVAERAYWIGRHLERTENAARLIRVYTGLMLDLPVPIRLGWGVLLNITGTERLFAATGEKGEEREVVRFLIAGKANPSSIEATVAQARENARTARETLPMEVWEQINDLHLFIASSLPGALEGPARHPFLTSVVDRCQLIDGILDGTMSRDPAHAFLWAGRSLERADMSTRIVDVGSATLGQDEESPAATVDEIVWMAILRSLSAYQMYRRHVRNRVNAHDVVTFLVQDELFPRSTRRAIDELSGQLERLPRNEAALDAVAHCRALAADPSVPDLRGEDLHDYLDEFQIALGMAHEAIVSTWFASPAAA